MTQHYQHKKPIQDFIADHHLQRANGVTSFAANIMYQDRGSLHTLASEVQIIDTSEIMAVYIYEFFSDFFGLQEMYSAENFSFGYNNGNALEIVSSTMQQMHITITPLL